jgi:hypothetical protein
MAIWLISASSVGINLNEKWSIVGLWLSFWFGAFAGLLGAGVAIWRE